MLVVIGVRCSMYLLVCICVDIAVRSYYVIHISHTHTDVIVRLLINSSMDICVIVAFVLFFSCEQ